MYIFKLSANKQLNSFLTTIIIFVIHIVFPQKSQLKLLMKL